MEIKMTKIKVAQIVDGFIDRDEEGVFGFGGKLNIRPPYQREFVYSEAQEQKVIETILKGFPLNVMYWSENDDGTYEIIDGQQRTLSFCNYTTNSFCYEFKSWGNLTSDIKQKILNYELQIYICKGTESEKLAWFEVINIAGEKLTPQELRNAIYSGSWTMAAKKFFSKTNGSAANLAKDYLSGAAIRQSYLETAIKWFTNGKDDKDIREYMAKHQHDENADELVNYFKEVIDWVKTTFPKKDKRNMPKVNWGKLFNLYGKKYHNPVNLAEKISILMADDEVTNKAGIYDYVLSGEEKSLNIRSFTDSQKRSAYERQEGICPHCGQHFEIEEMEGDHITPWSEGGKTDLNNLQMLCKSCNRRKSNK